MLGEGEGEQGGAEDSSGSPQSLRAVHFGPPYPHPHLLPQSQAFIQVRQDGGPQNEGTLTTGFKRSGDRKELLHSS